MAIGVPIEPDYCMEVAGISKQVLAGAEDKYKRRDIYATHERLPHVLMKKQVLGRLKTMAAHESGPEKVEVKWQPYFKVEVKIAEAKILFAALSPYGGGVKWGDGIKQLKWTEQQANKNFAALSR